MKYGAKIVIIIDSCKYFSKKTRNSFCRVCSPSPRFFFTIGIAVVLILVLILVLLPPQVAFIARPLAFPFLVITVKHIVKSFLLLYDLYRIIFIVLSQIRHYKIEHVVLDAIDASEEVPDGVLAQHASF